MITAPELNNTVEQVLEARAFASAVTEQAQILALNGLGTMRLPLEGRLERRPFCELVIECLSSAGYQLQQEADALVITWKSEEVGA